MYGMPGSFRTADGDSDPGDDGPPPPPVVLSIDRLLLLGGVDMRHPEFMSSMDEGHEVINVGAVSELQLVRVEPEKE